MGAGLVTRTAGPLRGWLSPHSLRARLLLLALLPILVVAPITAGFVVLWSRDYNAEQLLRRVNTDLAVAHDAFVRRQQDYLDQLRRIAGSQVLADAVARGDTARIQDLLAAVKGTSGFDFLDITDVQGRWLFRNGLTGHTRDSPLQRQVAVQGAAAVGIEIYAGSDLRAEDADLARHVVLPLIDTPRAAPSQRTVEDRAMVVRAIVPVRDVRGRPVALLDGGVVINRDFALVDGVRDLVYGPDSLLEGSIGTVTVFLDDVRISTNVPLDPGERALGTRVSSEVRERVLLQGETWRNRAFVVNDWYISAYEPIVDVTGERVGMLYAGYLEAPYRAAYERTVLVTLCLLAAGIALAGGLALWVARALARPIAAMVAVARELRSGHDVRIGQLDAGGELAELARQFDETLDLLTLRNEEIRLAAEGLELKVEERTQALQDNNFRLHSTVSLLESTRRALVASEKRAALGELTAGVAHEINNPLAIIQGNLEVMRLQLGERAAGVETELNLALAQVTRMQIIVRQLLDYSRSAHEQTELADLERIDARAVVDDPVTLAELEASSRGVDIQVRHGSAASVTIAPHELEQVLVNLLLNAVHFSPPGGTVQVETARGADGSVLIAVQDQGPGVKPEHRRRVFDPFFTTRTTGGTGLGLSVSYGIVRRHGGDISVSGAIGGGARFEVMLPAVAQAPARAATG
jgi:two-component system NtrC family sensor kinase